MAERTVCADFSKSWRESWLERGGSGSGPDSDVGAAVAGVGLAVGVEPGAGGAGADGSVDRSSGPRIWASVRVSSRVPEGCIGSYSSVASRPL